MYYIHTCLTIIPIRIVEKFCGYLLLSIEKVNICPIRKTTALIYTWYLSSEFSKNFYQKIRWRQNSSRISIRIPITKSDDYGILQRLQRALLIIYQCRGVLWGFINTHELKHINVSVENMILKMNAKSRRLDFKKDLWTFTLIAGTIKCVGLGDHDVSTSGETPSITRSLRNTKLSWQMHEKYYPGDENTLPRHDIAILVLDKPVDFQK